jgi:hypothetical protein
MERKKFMGQNVELIKIATLKSHIKKSNHNQLL